MNFKHFALTLSVAFSLQTAIAQTNLYVNSSTGNDANDLVILSRAL